MMSGKSCAPEARTNGFELLTRQLQPMGNPVGAALKHFDPAEIPCFRNPVFHSHTSASAPLLYSPPGHL